MSTPTPPDPMTPPPSARHAAVAGGEVFVWQPQPGISIQCARGVLTLPLATFLTDYYGERFAAGAQDTIFCEFSGLAHHTRDAREHVTEFVLAHRPSVLAIHFLIGSKLFAVAVTVFKYATGADRVHVYSARASFLQSYERVVQAGRR